MPAQPSETWKTKDTSLRMALLAAHDCNRKAVSAKWLWENPDVDGYFFVPEDDAFGLDPWQRIVGVDALRDESKIILEFGSIGQKLVDPDSLVFVPLS